MIEIAEVNLEVSGLGSEFELEEDQDHVVGLNNVLLENWMKFNDFDVWCT